MRDQDTPHTSTPAVAAPAPGTSGAAPRKHRKLRIGEALVEAGVLSQQQLNRALADQRLSGQRLGEMLADSGVISGTTLVHTLARNLGVKGCHLRHGLIDPALIQQIGDEACEQMLVVRRELMKRICQILDMQDALLDASEK